MSTSIEFPRFLYGTFASVQRAARKESKRWAKHYRATGTFPTTVATQVIEPLSIVHTVVATDLERLIVPAPCWRLYVAALLREALESRAVRDAFEVHVRGFAWGALAVAVEYAEPNSIDTVLARWDELDMLRYVGPPPVRVVRLAELMVWRFEGLFAMWLDARTGDVRSDLRAAVDAMRAAPPEVVRERVLRSLAREASGDERIRCVPELTDPAWLATKLAELDAEAIAELKSGYVGRLGRQLFIWKSEAGDRE